MYEIAIKEHFAAAHSLRNYDGDCKNLHGHTWKVEVVLQSGTLDAAGMVMDFKIIRKKLKELIAGLDHVHLNELPYFQEVNPTTENLAKYIYDEFSKICRPIVVSRVTVWESDTASVVYYRMI